MRFLLTDEQRAFAASLDALLTAGNAPAAARAWAAGDREPGRTLWARLAETGLFALAADEAYGGVGLLPLELALGYVELGRHAMPGPVVETAAAAALLSGVGAGRSFPGRLLPGVVRGETVATVVLSGGGRFALDADAADVVLVESDGVLRVAPGHGPVRVSSDPVRRLAVPEGGGEVVASGVDAGAAARLARLLTAAQSLGVGLALLERTVAYVTQRVQFGTPIGSFQAVKHRLTDTLVGLEFARPLVYGAALTLDRRDVAAAKVATADAVYAAARAALQLHGAVGYTDELDLALWLRKARPLRGAWGTPAACREVVLAGG
ncbi:acyl-CoA dehydrogenase family protein [Streptomyces sp. NPDC048057]|uniref:acyl-CoA dehydrogenase family protein n=1 Tax=Streptomyces sp. NPDC048057 TaxID=3155628 RepID=UPI0034079F9F